jgi:radical SAM superfamily enzyme YgiQ (UPF0313 family)
MDAELVRKLKAAGTHALAYAIESGSPKVQRQIGKNLDLAKAREMIKLTDQQGILVGGFFMFGFPGETKEEMLATLKFAMELPFFQANFFFVTPHPNTALYELALKTKPGLGQARIRNFFKFSVNLSAVPDAELEKMMDTAYSSFFGRPGQIWRIIKGLPDKLYVLKLFTRAFFLRRWA